MENVTVKIFDRRDMEYTVYKVSFNGLEKFILRNDNMNSGNLWYEVVKGRHFWEYADGESGTFTKSWLGFTKAEAVEKLIKKY